MHSASSFTLNPYRACSLREALLKSKRLLIINQLHHIRYVDLLTQRTSFFWEEVLSILIITHLLWSTNVTPRRSSQRGSLILYKIRKTGWDVLKFCLADAGHIFPDLRLICWVNRATHLLIPPLRGMN